MSYEYERVPTPSTGLRLHLNENTGGCSPRVLAAIRSITGEQAAFYPDYDASIAACAAHFAVPAERVLLTNGLDEGIHAVSMAAIREAPDRTGDAIIVVPAFDMYAACADVAGARVVEVPTSADFSFPLDAVLDAVGPAARIVFITSPNNPTGQPVDHEAILRIAAGAPQAMIFVDEAYAEFEGRTLLGYPALERLPNIIVGRTFAKAYGLAGLRIGALIGHPQTLAPVRRAVPPYTLNVCASVALVAALEDRDGCDRYLSAVRTSKELLYRALDRLGIRYWTSAANFVLADFGNEATRVVEGLARRGIHVRDRSNDRFCPGCIRITAGIVEHTETCISALEEVLCGAQP
jgi:histidinol-phosphate aminotransferase